MPEARFDKSKENFLFHCLKFAPAVDDNAAQYSDFWTDAPRHTFDTLHRLLQIL